MSIDREVKSIVMENYDKSRKLLNENLDVLNAMASSLLEREVLDGAEIDQIIEQHRSGPPSPDPGNGESV